MKSVQSSTLLRSEVDSSVAAANEEVAIVHNRKRKRGQYDHYDIELCVKIVK